MVIESMVIVFKAIVFMALFTFPTAIFALLFLLKFLPNHCVALKVKILILFLLPW